VFDDFPLLRDRLPDEQALTEVRLRAGQPMEVRGASGARLIGPEVTRQELDELLLQMTGYSIYACEERIRQGFFTLPEGHRVGLTGRYASDKGGVVALTGALSMCIRVARAVEGAADPLMPHLIGRGRLHSTLILSPPGLGKTTMLRDAARQLSGLGYRVALADERGELSAPSAGGLPTMELGPRCDVATGANKAQLIERLVRSMAPDVVVTDELGGEGDARAVYEAACSGVMVLASAHAADIPSARRKRGLAPLMEDGLFECFAVLGGAPGRVIEIVNAREGPELTHSLETHAQAKGT
jgi:stage III sporulation protein AA